VFEFKKFVLCGTGSAAIAATIIAAPSYAQSTAGTESRSWPQVLEEVVVSARKRQESLQDTPVVVDVFTGEELDRFGITSLNALSEMTPGLVIGNTHNNVGGTIAIRGIGAATQNSAVDQAVSVNLDGIQVSQGNILRLGQFDLQQVEILKGPQALFFGKNSTAGVVSLTSRDPGDEFESHIKVGHEFNQEQSYFDAAISGPLGGGFGGRLFIYGSDQTGWFKNRAAESAFPGLGALSDVDTSPKEREIATRLTLTYASPGSNFNSRLKITLNDVDRENGPAAASQKFHCPLGDSQLSASFLTGGSAPRVDDCEIDRYWVAADPFPGMAQLHPSHSSSPQSDFQQRLVSFEANWDMTESLRVTSVTGYYSFDQEYFDMYTNTNTSILGSSSDMTNKQWTQELRLSSDFEGSVNFMLGGFYQSAKLEDEMTVALDVLVPVATLLASPTYQQDTDSYSVFAEIAYDLNDSLELSVGGRYTKEEKQLDGTTFDQPIVVAFDANEYDDFSLQSTLSYHLDADSMLYASYREAFIAGGFDFNPVPAFGPSVDISYKPSTVNGFEVGYKTTLQERSLRLDVAAYRYEYDDLQLAARDSATLALTTVNAGEATVQGMEAGLQWLPNVVPGLTLSTKVAYTDATYDEFIASCYTGQSITEGCTLLPDGTGAFTSQDLSGEDLVRSPDWTANFGFLYDTDLTPGLGISFSLNANYSADFEATIENDPRAKHKDYWILNGNMSLYSLNNQWRVSLVGRNLGNELIRPNSFSSPLSGSGTGTNNPTPSDLFGVVGDPREVALEARWNF